MLYYLFLDLSFSKKYIFPTGDVATRDKMVFDPEDNVFMIPGPVKIHPRVLRSMNRPSLGHRSSEFRKLNQEAKELTRYLFQTKYDVAVLTGSGTAAMDGAIGSTVHKGDKVVSILNGKFGERLADIAEVYSGNVTKISAPWGMPENIEKLKKELEKRDVKLVTLVHNETSTGFCHRLKEISRIVKKYNTLLMVDCITSAACIELKPDEWGLDIVISGSQKGIAAPAGLSMLAVSPRALDQMHSENQYYLDVKKHIEKFKDNDTPYTPAIHLFYGYVEALRMLKEEGIENRIARVKKTADACREAIKAIGLEFYAQEGYYSNTLTAVKKPDGTDISSLCLKMSELGVSIAGSQAPHSGEFFRIGHMGLVELREIAVTIATLEVALKKLGCKIKLGEGVSAVEKYM
jgi:aspartate aminotransferase-like enzyme